MWTYYNLFQPVLRQEEKTIERPEGGDVIIHRHRDSAQTPWERLCRTEALPLQARTRLADLYARTNPRTLKRSIQEHLDALLSTCP